MVDQKQNKLINGQNTKKFQTLELRSSTIYIL